MKKARHTLLARAAFPSQEDGGVALGHLFDQGEDVLHGRTFPQHLFASQVIAEVFDLPAHTAFFVDAFEDMEEFGVLERLAQKIVGALVGGLQRGFDRGVGGHHHHLDRGVLFARGSKHRHAIDRVHFQVGHHRVKGVFLQEGYRLLAAARDGATMPLLLQVGLKKDAHFFFVVDNQDVHAFSFEGRQLPLSFIGRFLQHFAGKAARKGVFEVMADPTEEEPFVEETRSWKRRWLINLSLVIVSGLVALALGEIALRIFYTPQAPTIPHRSHHHTRLPNSSARWTSAQGEFDTRVRFNSHGLRGSEPDLGREHLWVFMGDSMIEALQVPEEETVTYFLEEELGDAYTVMNAGVGGYSPILMRLRLEALLEKLAPEEPDLVLLGLFPNDLEEEYMYRVAAYEDRQGQVLIVTPGVLRGPLGRLKTFIFRHSVLFQLLQKTFGDPGMERNARVDPHFPSEEVLYPFRPAWTESEKRVWSTLFRSIGEIRNVCESRGIDLVIVIGPPGHQVNAEAWKTGKQEMNFPADYAVESTSFQDEIIKRARRIGIPTIDLLPEFKKHPSPEDLYFDYDGHWTAAGHQFAAEVIHEKLRELENEEESF